jgi:hypothetical protein
MPKRRVTAEQLAAQAPVRLAYVAQTGDRPKRPYERQACLGSRGVISTSSCNTVALVNTGALCPVCAL